MVRAGCFIVRVSEGFSLTRLPSTFVCFSVPLLAAAVPEEVAYNNPKAQVGSAIPDGTLGLITYQLHLESRDLRLEPEKRMWELLSDLGG